MRYSNGPDGRYRYVGDLMKLYKLGESCGMIDSRLASVNLPLNYADWKQQLQGHPDQDFVEYILNRIQGGFRIGINPIASFKSVIMYFAWEDQSEKVCRIDHKVVINCITVLYEPYSTVMHLIVHIQHCYALN